MQLSQEYENAFCEMLKSTSAWTRGGDRKMTAFFPVIGEAYRPGGVMVIGRAVNGWATGFEAGEMANQDTLDARFKEARDLPWEETTDPMNWLGYSLAGKAGYKAKRSDFWALVQSAVRYTHPDLGPDAPWWSHLAWTNLAKVSPHAGGNPPDSLWRVQIEHMKTLLAMEIATFKPSVILAVTDYWYNEFLEVAGPKWETDTPNEFVQRVGKISGTTIVVTKRPERKPRAEVASKVIAALKEHPSAESNR